MKWNTIGRSRHGNQSWWIVARRERCIFRWWDVLLLDGLGWERQAGGFFTRRAAQRWAENEDATTYRPRSRWPS